jgi:transcriptional regulator with PAS, ATPase and Fis domain
LVEYFIDRSANNVGKNITGINKKSLELLQSYSWPGNIRELQNVIERSVIMCEAENFSVDETWLPQQPVASECKGPSDFSEKLGAQEKEMIASALRESEGTGVQAIRRGRYARHARSTVESKIRSLRINKNHFKSCTATPADRSWFESVSMTPRRAKGAG